MVPVSDRKVIPHALERRLCIDADAAMSQVVSAVDGGQPLSAQLKSSTVSLIPLGRDPSLLMSVANMYHARHWVGILALSYQLHNPGHVA